MRTIITELIHAGASIDQTDHLQLTAFDCAGSLKNQVEDLLKPSVATKHQPSINAPSDNLYNPWW
jgi:hypothetical protein